MSVRTTRAVLWQEDGRWFGRLDGSQRTLKASTKQTAVAALRRAAGPNATLTIEVTPALVGVSEAAEILGWDRRRVITYVDRGSFPEPIAALAGGRVWRREDIEAYAAGRRKAAGA